MKIILTILLWFSLNYAFAEEIKVDVDVNKIKDGIGLAQDALSDKKARTAGELDGNVMDLLNKSKSSMTDNMKSLAGENEGKISNLIGDKTVDGKINCMGESKIASVSFTEIGGVISMNVKLERSLVVNIPNIKGVCSAGISICDKGTNDKFCFASIGRTSEELKANHSCNLFKDDICRNWQPLVNSVDQLVFEPLGDTCKVIGSVTDDTYNTLIGQITGAMSKKGIPVGRIEREGKEATIYSMQSENCILEDFGSGLKDMRELNSLYNPKTATMPDASDAIKESVADNNSIYNLIQKGNEIDYNGNSIGQPTFNKCEINNTVNVGITETVKKDNFSGSYNFCTDHFIKSRVRRVHGQILIEMRGGDGGDSMKGCYGWAGAESAKGNDGWFSVYNVSAPATLADARLTYYVVGGGCPAGNGSYSLMGEDSNNVICSASGTQYPEISWQLEMVYSEDSADIELITSNTCDSIELNSECVIQQEKVCDNKKMNCIETIKDGRNSGLKVHIPCYETVSGVYIVNICPKGDEFYVSTPLSNKNLPIDKGLGWSNIQRQYRCSEKLSGMGDVTKGLGDIFGIIGDGADGIKIPDDVCYIQFCTTSKRYDINNLYGSGSTNSSIGNQASITQLVKQCDIATTNDGLKFSCPLQPGEVITENCSCDNKNQIITNLSDVLLGFAMAEELKKYLDCDNSTDVTEP